MTLIRALAYSCFVLATLKFSSGFEGIPHFNASEIGLSQLPGTGAGFPIQPPFNLFGSPNFSFPFFGGFGFGFGSRSKRQAEEATNDTQHDEHESRLFFSRYPTITSCNTTTQGGSSCLNCRQALTCLSNNIGLLTTCRGFLPYCNGGRCTRIQPANCTT